MNLKQKAEAYFADKYGGISTKESVKHGEYIYAAWAVTLMADFHKSMIKESMEAKEKELKNKLDKASYEIPPTKKGREEVMEWIEKTKIEINLLKKLL